MHLIYLFIYLRNFYHNMEDAKLNRSIKYCILINESLTFMPVVEQASVSNANPHFSKEYSFE